MKPNFPHRLRYPLARIFTRRNKAASLALTGFAGILIVSSWVVGKDPQPRSSAAAIPSSPGTSTRLSFAPQERLQGELHPTTKNESPRGGQPADTTARLHAALSTACAIADPLKREEALTRLCYERAESDPREALELAIEHDLEGSPGVIANLAQQWAAVDLPSARAWAESQPEGPMREDLFARIGYVWSLSDPAAAARFVSTSTATGDSQTEAAISVLHQWSARDSKAARAWVECFPEGPTRDRALHETDGPRAGLPDD